MPRDLADVLHYFLPEYEVDPASGQIPPRSGASISPTAMPTHSSASPSAPVAASPSPPPLPILGIPIGDREIVRAALAWNLAVETARLGAAAIVLAPAADRGSPLWPEPGFGPLGAELHVCEARSLGELHRSAVELAHRGASSARRGGLVIVRIPTRWLETASACEESHPADRATPAGMDGARTERGLEPQPFRWLLLLSSARPRDLKEAYGLAEVLLESSSRPEIGVTIHGVRSVEEARDAFDRLNERVEASFGQSLFSYGLLVDDLDVYRAIAAQRPIGLAHPQAPASRALMDVARLVYEDARSRVLG